MRKTRRPPQTTDLERHRHPRRGPLGADRSHGRGPAAHAGGRLAEGHHQDPIDEIHSWQHSSDPKEGEKYRSDAVQAELRGLYRRLEGDGPILGAGGEDAVIRSQRSEDRSQKTGRVDVYPCLISN